MILSGSTCRRRRTHSLLWAIIGVGVGALGACRAPPLTERDERSPYDRYDAVRNQRADPYTEDKFGNKIPNLRERLLPRN